VTAPAAAPAAATTAPLPAAAVHFALRPDLDALDLRTTTRLCIDMPLGFAVDGSRPVEGVLRQALPTGARNRVFPVPVRGVIDAWPVDHETACTLNAEACGRRLPLQTWHIGARMAELDRRLRNDARWRACVAECHPELAFARLGGGTPPRKKTDAGRRWRLQVLRGGYRRPDALLRRALGAFPRTAVLADDVLDALVLAWTARLPATAVEWLPDAEPRDACGIRMAVLAPRGDRPEG
jgi:predicted RNase H-like nuclease